MDALYYDRNAEPDTPISLGPIDPKYRVTIRIAKYRVNEQRNEVTFGIETIESTFMGVKKEYEVANNPIGERLVVRRRDLFASFDSDDSELPHAVICESLGPNVLSNNDIARFWDSVALTDSENLAVDALNLVYDGVVERVAMIGDGGGHSRHIRRAAAKAEGERRPVPLRSLGDGAVRIFGIALALANIHGGFLLLDEVENGIHHSVQRDFWKMILTTAQANDVQVFATTHSWDCVTGFAQAMLDMEDSISMNGTLIRLDRRDERIRAVEYSKRDLEVAAEQGIEVR